MFPNLISSFRRVTKPITTTICATTALLAGTMSLTAQETPEWPHVKAENDPAIIAACPAITDGALVTIPTKHTNAGFISSQREFNIGFIKPDFLASEDEIVQKDWILYSMNTAGPSNMIILNVNSTGGAGEVAQQYVQAARNTHGKVVTRSHYAASAATLVLFGGTPGFRNVFNNTPLIVHAARNVTQAGAAYALENNTKPAPEDIHFVEDYDFSPDHVPILEQASALEDVSLRNELLRPFGLTETDVRQFENFKRLQIGNAAIRAAYVSLSGDNINLDCATTMISGKIDVLINPETALKFHWIDTVYNLNNAGNALDGTITVRYDDPRAAAYRQTVAVTYPDGVTAVANRQPRP